MDTEEGKRRSARPTLRDVARRANVSVATASKALRGTDRVSAATTRLVQSAARELGYRKSTDRRAQDGSPAAGGSGLVGLITSDYNGRFALPMLTGAESTLGASNHAALLMSSHGRPALEQSHIDQLAARGVDGLIVVGDTSNARLPLKPSTTMGLPVVYTYDPSTDPDDCSVVCDNVGAGAQAIEYLLSLRRRYIAVIAGPEDFQAAHDRVKGAWRTFTLYDFRPVAVLYDSWSEEWGERAARVLVERYPHLDAIYALSDEIARGAVRGLMAIGKHVPQDVAVIGHDNWFVFCSNAHPTLTTFDNNIALIGKTAAKCLLDAIRGHPHHGVITVECPMIVRESTEMTRKTTLESTDRIFRRNTA
ncbi:LacI family DNA-binding transcriptional regulator [Bifidobacterium vespertilionis]|uniref:LacI family transcriptional regulator n=1 Tax=Bifidobacterium vespertilionis TaxID=2562524 RepID=A0A5J5DZI4_9BIFI|nr:LacI family DNA-binding transcriptional regulator [Bifidobacterium vespertilionis]KAA8818040.1 LacI family transcriptional regulator [Bifidobacterium vespertilionis]KAA8822308.1 LacI family transcriptional regulator [Bifidobacterium vespertilionis]